MVRKSLNSPEETHPFEADMGKLKLVNMERVAVGAWIVGDEPCVVIDWQGFTDYAKR